MAQNNLLKFCYLNLNKFLFLQIRKNFNQPTSLLQTPITQWKIDSEVIDWFNEIDKKNNK